MTFKDIISFLRRPISFKAKNDLPYGSINAVGTMGFQLGELEDFEYYTSWGYACISKIAQGIANSDWRLFELKSNNEVVEIEDHELLALLKNPNPIMSEYDFKEMIITLGEIYGRMPLVIFRDSTGKPNELWPALPPSLKIKKVDENGYPLVWEYSFGNKKVEYKNEDIIDLKYPSPKNPVIEANAPLEAIKKSLNLEMYMTDWNIGLMENDARPPMIIKYPEPLTEEQKEKLQEMFRQQYQGFNRAYKKVLVLTGGAEVDSRGYSPKELDFSSSRDQIRDKILSSFGVPKSILGLESNVNRASMEQAEINFAKYTLEPKLKKITSQLNKKIVPEFGENLWLDFEPLVFEDKEIQLLRYDKAVNRWMTINEIRKEIGLPEVDGGDYLYMSFNVMPVGGSKGERVIKVKTPKAGLNLKIQKTIRKNILARNLNQRKIEKEIEQKFEQKIKTKIKEKRKANKVLIISKKKQISQEAKEKFYETRTKKKRILEEEWRKAITKLFKKQKEKIIERLKRRKSLVNNILPPKQREIRATIKIIEPLYYQTLMAGAEDASRLVGEEIIDIINLPQTRRWVERIAKEYAEEITDTTFEDLAALLKDGLEQGLGVYELGNNIEDYFSEIGSYRADMIARTETARATIESHAIIWDELGFEKAEWLLGPNPCEICQEMEKREWLINEIRDEIPVHPNCECDFTPLVE